MTTWIQEQIVLYYSRILCIVFVLLSTVFEQFYVSFSIQSILYPIISDVKSKMTNYSVCVMLSDHPSKGICSCNIQVWIINSFIICTKRKKNSKFFTSLGFVSKSMSLKCFRIEQLCPSIYNMISLDLNTTPLCNRKS